MLDITPNNSNLDSLDEGVEFGYRKNGDEWIPLAFYSSNNNQDNQIKVGELNGDNLSIRGYSVPFFFGDIHSTQLKLCGSEVTQDNASLTFRWLQTVNINLRPSVDDVGIDDVQIGINSPTQQLGIVLLMDNFNNLVNIK